MLTAESSMHRWVKYSTTNTQSRKNIQTEVESIYHGLFKQVQGARKSKADIPLEACAASIESAQHTSDRD